jgi:hypothetical protein
MSNGVESKNSFAIPLFDKIFYTNIFNLQGNNFEFERNLPSNIQEEADTATKLHGRISDETLFGLLSFIDDPQAEMERIRKEQRGGINLDALLGAMEKGDAERALTMSS